VKLRLVLTGVALSYLGTASFAASPTDEQAAADKFAHCLVSRAPALVKRGLIEFWAPSKYLADLKPSLFDRCIGESPNLPMYSPDFRHALALEWLKRSDTLLSSADFGSVPPLSHDAIEGRILRRIPPGETAEKRAAQYKALQDQQRVLAKVGECVVRGHPETVRQFLRARTNLSAINTIVPILTGCVPANTQLKLEPAYLTGLLALTYVRLALAADAGKVSE
jgi:hypothetical protein